MSETSSHAGAGQAGDELPLSMQLVQLVGGFQTAQAIYVIAKLDIATLLDDGPKTVAELAAASGARPDLLRRLIRTLAPVGLFRHLPDGTVETTPLGATLSANRADSARDTTLFWMETHYLPFSELLHNTRTGETAATRYFGEPFFKWISRDPERVKLQTNAMASLTENARGAMFGEYRLPPGEVVADIGGASGSVLARLLENEPGRRGIVFDLPEVAREAQRYLEQRGLTDRIEAVGGNFFESVPRADVYLLSFILHDWDDDNCRRILGNIKAAAEPGARLVAVDGVVPPGDEPHVTKTVDLIMLALSNGKERSAEEFDQLFTSAGFRLDNIVPTPTPFSFIEATPRP